MNIHQTIEEKAFCLWKNIHQQPNNSDTYWYEAEKSIGLEKHFTEKIYDNIYGFVYLTPWEKKLLSTSYFQRIGNIRQLGLADYVFPGATHTRLAHSIGVLYIVEKLIQKYKQLRPIDFKIHAIVRLAALLHDIGHYPLSHTIEASYLEYSYANNDTITIEDEEDKKLKLNLKNLNIGLDKYLHYYKKSKRDNHHEEIGAELIRTTDLSEKIKKFTKDFFEITDFDLRQIGYLITGNKLLADEYLILSKFIKSKFDADQMDYMIRDTKNTGIKALIDLDFIIDNMIIKNDKICFSPVTIQAIEQFLLSKYYWYSRILYYEKSSIMNFIAQRLYSNLLLNNEVFTKDQLIKIASNDPEHFSFFNDNYFWQKIYESFINNIDEDLPDISYKLAKCLVKKQFPILNTQIINENVNESISNMPQLLTMTDEEQNILKQQFKQLVTKEQNTNYLAVHIDREVFSIKEQDKGYLDDSIYIYDRKNDEYIKFENVKNQLIPKIIATKDHDENVTLNIFRVYDFKNILETNKQPKQLKKETVSIHTCFNDYY